jgi:zinc-ribbon domain
MFCTQCGAKLTEGLKFCTSCGSRIKAEQQPAPSSPEVIPTSTPEPVIGSQPTTATEPMAGEIEKTPSQPGAEIDFESVTASPPPPPASTQEEPPTPAPETQTGAGPTTPVAPSGQSSSEALDSSTSPQQEASQAGPPPPAIATPPSADRTIPIPTQEAQAAPRDASAQGKRSGLRWVWVTVALMAVIAVAAGGYFGVKYFYNSAPQQTGSPASGPAGQSGPSNSAQAGQETNPNSVPTPNASEATAQPPRGVAVKLPAPPTRAGSEQTAKPEIKSERQAVAGNQPSSPSKKQGSSLGFGSTPRSATAALGGVAPAVAPPETSPSTQAPVRPTAATQPVSPPVASLRAIPASITEGQSATLTWNTENATEVSIQPGVGSVAAHGSVAVAPNTPTTYTLTAIGTGHSATVSAKVEVLPAGPSEGTIVWQGEVHGVSPVSIEGNHASIGAVVGGGLPGLPCTVRLESSKGVTLQTTPDKWNGWKLIVLQIRGNGRVTVRLSWSLLR